MGDISLSILLNAKNNTGGVFSQVTSTLSNMVSSLKSGDVGGFVGAFTKGVIGIGAAAKQMAAQYEQSMNMVQSLTGTSSTQMSEYDSQLKKLAVDTGVAPVKLAQGLYPVISANYRGADAIRILTLATKDSVIGMTDATVTSKSLITVMQGYSEKVSNADKVNGEMLRTVTLGQMTMRDYSNAISKTAANFGLYHVSLETTNAALATLTVGGYKSATVAATGWIQLQQQVIGNTDKVSKNIEKLGIQGFDPVIYKSLNFTQRLSYLNTVMQGHTDKLKSVLGGSQQAAMAFSTLEQHSKIFSADLKELNNQQKNAKATQDEWNTTSKGFNASMSKLDGAFQVLMIDIGQNLLPGLTSLADKITPVVTNFTKWLTQSDGLKKSLDKWQGVIKTTAITLAVFFTPALIKAGVEAVISALKIGINFVGSVILAGSSGWASAAKLLAFIGSMIASGAQAVFNGAKIVANYVGAMIVSDAQVVISSAKINAFLIGSMIKSGATAAATATKIAVTWIATMVKAGIQAGLTAAKVAATWIATMIKAGAQSLISAAQMTASFIASLIKAAAQSIITGATMLATLVPALISTGLAALAAAAPFILAGAIIAAVVIGIILVVRNWSSILTWMQGVATNVWNTVVGTFKGAVSGISNALTLIKNVVTNMFNSLVSGAVGFGSSLINGFVSGIKGAIGNVKSAVSSVWSAVSNFFPHSPPKEGPGKALPLWGPALVNMFSNDIRSNAPKARAAAESMMSQVATAMQKYPGEIAQATAQGNKAQVASLKQQMSLTRTQESAYKDLLREMGYKFNQYNLANPINFSQGKRKYSVNGMAPVYGNPRSATATNASGATTSSTSSGGNTYIVVNLNLNLPKGTAYQTAKDITAIVDKYLANRVRGSASLTTTSSGGAA